MSALIIGFLIIFLIFGAGAAFLYSSGSGAVSLTRVATVGSTGGILGSITMVFTDTWKFLTAALYGHLGLYGWILVIGVGLCVGVWIYNAITDASNNKPIAFVK